MHYAGYNRRDHKGLSDDSRNSLNDRSAVVPDGTLGGGTGGHRYTGFAGGAVHIVVAGPDHYQDIYGTLRFI